MPLYKQKRALSCTFFLLVIKIDFFFNNILRPVLHFFIDHAKMHIRYALTGKHERGAKPDDGEQPRRKRAMPNFKTGKHDKDYHASHAQKARE